MKKSPANEEAVKQLLQELKKKIVGNLRLKDVIEEFLNSCKENMPDHRVPITIPVQDGSPCDPGGKIPKRFLER